MSSQDDIDLPPYPTSPSTQLWRFPIGAATSDMNSDINYAIPHQEVISQIQQQIASYGFSAVMIVRINQIYVL